MPEIWEHPPSAQKTSIVDPLGGGAVGDPGEPTIITKNVDDRSLGGDVGDSGVPTIKIKNVNGRPLRRRC
jgi:hypothetical protein